MAQDDTLAEGVEDDVVLAHHVAAHEVAHLARMDHSAAYWAGLARLMPGYEAPRRWLKEHGRGLLAWDFG